MTAALICFIHAGVAAIFERVTGGDSGIFLDICILYSVLTMQLKVYE